MERYTTEHFFHQWYEHWHRYHWISSLVKDQRVADVACGEGYGSALLAQQAKYVTAVDIDAATIKQAQQKYQQENLDYICANALNTGLDAAQFDCITSFETLEHLAEHDALLLEFKRLLKQDGFLVISTPDKDVYSPQGKHNHHHVKELNRDEFQAMLSKHFKHHVLFGQQLQLGSVIEPLDHQTKGVTLKANWVKQGQELVGNVDNTKPQYLLAIATDSKQQMESISTHNGSWFNDSENSLFKHYEQQIARLMSADKRLSELEQRLQQQAAMISHLKARLGL